MIILSATMHPHGDASRAYELLHATIDNRTRLEDEGRGDRYMALVCARPNRFLKVSGYEADVQVKEHRPADGPTALIVAVLNAARGSELCPPAQLIARTTLEDAAAFERRLREGAR